MPPRCSICLSSRRADVDAALLRAEPTTRVAADFGFSQSAVSRHQLKHVRPHVQAIANSLAPLILPPPSPIDIIPSMTAMLSKLGSTVARAEQLVQDAEAEGGIAGRAVSINSLRAVLTDTAKLLGALGPQAAPVAPPEQINRAAIRDALAAVLLDDRDAVLERLGA